MATLPQDDTNVRVGAGPVRDKGDLLESSVAAGGGPKRRQTKQLAKHDG
jgi:hypothetical protein